MAFGVGDRSPAVHDCRRYGKLPAGIYTSVVLAAPGRACGQLPGRRRTWAMIGTMERGRADYATIYVARSSVYRALA
jgi:hypothetical protein